jgi:hypothetical protein
MNDTIEQLNIFWRILLRLYEKKDSLPLGNFNPRYYLINGRKEDQEIEISNWLNQWAGKLTKQNWDDLKEVTDEIDKYCLQLNEKLMELSLKGSIIVPFTDFTPADLHAFSIAMRDEAITLAVIRKTKPGLLKARDFETLCQLRNKEKAIIGLVCKEFQDNYPGIYFKKSWFNTAEVFHLPSKRYELQKCLRRISRNSVICN